MLHDVAWDATILSVVRERRGPDDFRLRCCITLHAKCGGTQYEVAWGADSSQVLRGSAPDLASFRSLADWLGFESEYGACPGCTAGPRRAEDDAVWRESQGARLCAVAVLAGEAVQDGLGPCASWRCGRRELV